MSRSFPWDSKQVGIGADGYPVYDRSYDAQDLRDQNMAHFTDGVVRKLLDQLLCTHEASGSPMSVSVASGIAEVQGGTFINDDATTLAIAASDPQPRIDTIVVRFDKSLAVRDIYLDVVRGTPSSNPVHPTLTRDGTVWELGIADVMVGANANAISTSDITMTIDDTGRCGWSESHADANVGLKAYPVGSLYLSFVDISPAELFGGDWVQLASGRYLRIGADTNTGGADTITLTAAQLASHNHGVMITRSGLESPGYGLTPSGTGFVNRVIVGLEEGSTIARYNTMVSGGSAAHSNMPSYQDVYAWKRIA